ncbi:MAG: hypothetical protein A2487_15440 [Candidatus Raymondbacteria bacterium RifOxyC12_full_50_8]|uniref:Uncharacterized protein n=1 Tax=Candidatus Raymondbacteria bacterium RIFOXYD12_FULL_49_13 TaxID=1817890 RepID=A0A1F7FA98_UNCRA|nr:MAG: hypothetical protein A2248_22455 [Candidatus Raymondbacteria bacterium RIFOXYA2_FULL_49_16]OGJ93985.1 MAG: hypothetical protein A2350_19465 [Candidatus Raymondbacteria bacterium RifOxyB12_full_50_8]OGJ94616.1 MAG: hypothetical protein A2487_15440 [Candidatus Raymondbacteria bacterium RifOxyC12_full_50_8]OGK03528.1 MAG: hypothetical protein A2519_09850 [Candidatus Raymondbacteria bacterium RIFOXYD12_FULL_49_13]OGP42799.1 MAG: hypothetical protein A2324_15950 [Candidatus Raymondbacteria b
MSKIGDASHNNSLYVGQVTFFGIIIRAHELFLGGIEQIYLDNRHLLQASARGLIETIGLVCFVSEKPSKVHSLLLDYDIPAGKLMHKASKRIKNAGDFYNKLSSWVHPGKNSLLAGFKPIGNGDNKTYISLPPPSLSENEIYRVLETLIGLVKIFYDSTNAFLEKYSNYLIDGILAGEKANLFVP